MQTGSFEVAAASLKAGTAWVQVVGTNYTTLELLECFTYLIVLSLSALQKTFSITTSRSERVQ